MLRQVRIPHPSYSPVTRRCPTNALNIFDAVDAVDMGVTPTEPSKVLSHPQTWWVDKDTPEMRRDKYFSDIDIQPQSEHPYL